MKVSSIAHLPFLPILRLIPYIFFQQRLISVTANFSKKTLSSSMIQQGAWNRCDYINIDD